MIYGLIELIDDEVKKYSWNKYQGECSFMWGSKLKINFIFFFSFRDWDLLDVFDPLLNKILRVDLTLMRLRVLISRINLFSNNVYDGILELGKLFALNSIRFFIVLLEDQKVWSHFKWNPFMIVQEYVEISKRHYVLSIYFLCDVRKTPQHLPANWTGFLLCVKIHDLDWRFEG
jgi:hypothetical protein